MKSILLIILLFLFAPGLFAQEFRADQVCLSQAELKLAEHINAFRKENRKPVLPLSAALSFVAQTHVKDLQENHPDTSICLTASWSDKGNWTACCYNKYLVNQECMWGKPKELTSYPFRGYELSYFQEEVISVDSIFSLWLKNEETRDMLLTTGLQSTKRWETMGIGMSDNYVSVWFGQRADAAGKPKNCEDIRESKIAQGKQKNAAERYYLIYGSFLQEADAKEAIKRYQKNGFKNAVILRTDQRIRIALDVFDNLKEATESKEKLGSTYKDAWILKE
ncbi:MAG: SPOR domain-containing protein [Bacteroidales bacterium]|nr:SPOR domain-containing protein [Bacteroidales bacterium]HOI31780.1 SPOR domain-containing protein [Bacteroidales bacterium]